MSNTSQQVIDIAMNTIDQMKKMLDVNSPIIYIHNHDFVRVDELIDKAIGQDGTIEEWNPVTGRTDFHTKESRKAEQGLFEYLFEIYEPALSPRMNRFVVLKEIQDEFDRDPRVKSLLMLIAQRRLYDHGIEGEDIAEYRTTVIIVSSVNHVPESLVPYVSFLEEEFPDENEINAIIDSHLYANNDKDNFKDEDRQKLLPSLKGLTAFEIDRTLDMAMSSNGTLRADDRELILRQKKHMVKKSGLLELIDTPESLDSIGGMEVLKEYLRHKSEIMSHIGEAMEYGVKVPKGVFIVGMPGCGKSLCAKATAAQFEVPLLKLDMGSMMGKYVGESEGNLRRAIKIAEAAAPCVLWIDEIEKAFSGVGGSNSEIVTRMFGYFLTWLQDKKSAVYVVATANNANNLPPELKRKGRFDEIFCVNLPNDEERKAIFNVHFTKKKRIAGNKIEFEQVSNDLVQVTKGFNGADIESVVDEVVEQAYRDMITPQEGGEKQQSDRRIKITTDMLIAQAKKTVSISKSCNRQIEEMKQVFKESNFTDASKPR